MSDERRDAMYPNGLGHPHEGDPRVDPRARGVIVKTGRRQSAKKLEERGREEEAMGEGFFPKPVVTVEVAANPKPEVPLRDRALRFEQGAPLFRVIYKDELNKEIVIPRTPEQANEMFLGRLPMRLELPVDGSCIERGKKGGSIIRCVGKSVFGAFTIVQCPIIDEDGREIAIPVLADINDRTSKKNNEVIRFRKEVSGEDYYLSLPRPSLRRRS